MQASDFGIARSLFPKAADVVASAFGGALPSLQVPATAVTSSEDGSFLAVVEADFIADEDAIEDDDIDVPDGYSLIEVPSSANVNAGDSVLLTLQGNKALDAGSAGWGDRVNAAAAAAATLAQEAKDIADAIGQYAWNDTNGTHVSTEEGVAEGTRNILLNSYGILLRAAANYLAALSQSGIAFYDGQGNAAENILASFGVSGAQVGRLTEPHIILDNDSFNTYDDQNRLVSHIDSLGWWRYKPVDEYPNGDTTKPVNPDYDPNNPSTLESFIGNDSSGLSYIFDKVVFGDWSARSVYDDVHDLWWPTPGRDVTFDVRSREDSVLRLTATEYLEGQEPAPHGATVEIESRGRINVYGGTYQHGNIILDNNNAIRSLDQNSVNRSLFVLDANGNLQINWGMWDASAGITYLNGNTVAIRSKAGTTINGYDADSTAWVYLAGSSSGNRVRYCKRSGIVFVEVWYESSAGLSTTAKTLGTLPAGFRPDVQVETAAFGNVSQPVMLRVNPGGSIVAKVMSGTTNYVKGCISFPV